jgi:hypothetical protein
MRNFVGTACVALWLTACTSNSHDADLPSGWEAAERLEELSQMPCAGSALTNESQEALAWTAASDSLSVFYDHAHFRCVQDVEAFMKRGDDAIDILVQPIDMNPTAVAGCDCLYDISMQVPAPKGDYTLTLYRRWDNMNRPNTPVKIGDAELTVE